MSTDAPTAAKPVMDTPAIRKFLFDRSFDDGSSPGASVRDRRPVTYSYEQLEALKKEIHDAAFAAGKKAASDDQTKRMTAIVEQIATNVGKLLAQADEARRKQEPRVREAVLAIARKILPDFASRNGMAEIEAVVAGVIGEMANEPRLVVRVNDTQFDSIDATLKAVTEKQGYQGKIVLLADAEVLANDCLIEWADGGIERNLEALWKNLGNTLAPGQDMPQEPAKEQAAAAPAAEPAAPPTTNTAG